MEDKTLRDEFAMRMPESHIPDVHNQAGLDSVSASLGIETVNINASTEQMLAWVMKMRATVRYKYADAMMEARAKRK